MREKRTGKEEGGEGTWKGWPSWALTVFEIN